MDRWNGLRTLWPAHTPFFRRFFVDEKEREQQETRQLYNRVKRSWPNEDVVDRIATDLMSTVGFYIEDDDKRFSPQLREYFLISAKALFALTVVIYVLVMFLIGKCHAERGF